MHDIYHFITGPAAAVSLAFFFGGMLFHIIRTVTSAYQKERFIFSYLSLRYGMRSLLHWLTPFATVNMKMHPFMTVVTFVFHICVLLVPVFLLSHIVLMEELLNIQWRALPDHAADLMAVLVVGACIFFLARRIIRPEVRYLSTPSDFLLLALVALPFLSGFYAFHQWPGYSYAVILHILSGELLLVMIPFTRLRHMIIGLLSRFYTGSEFGKVRHARDW